MESSTDEGAPSHRTPHAHLLYGVWTRTKSVVLDRAIGVVLTAALAAGYLAFVFFSEAWIWSSEWLEKQRFERVEAYRSQAEDELWTARNMTFEGPFSEELAQLIRRHHLDQAVLLELRARRLEDGRLVKMPGPAEWSENVFTYPMDLMLPLDMKYPSPSTP